MPWADKTEMSENEVLGHLESGEFDRVNNALVYLVSASTVKPTERVIEKVIELCSNSDPDIRNEAIYVAGFRWKVPRVLPLLVVILSNTCTDELVLNTAVYAVGELLRTHPDLYQQGIDILCHIALNDSMPHRVRESAYASVAWNVGRLSADQYARMGTPGSEVVIDRDWLNSLITADT